MVHRIPIVLWLACGIAAGAAAEFDSSVKTTVMVPMRDGVRLSTDVYVPARAGAAARERFPVLLVRTPYNKTGGTGKQAEALAPRGYVVLAQDVRGRFASEGEFYPFVNEGLDGYDAIEWAAAQPWSNGKVGMFGGSYLAWDQYHAAMYKPPHLASLYAMVGGATFYDEYAFPGGVPNLGWARWILSSALTSPQAARDPEIADRLRAVAGSPAQWLALPPGPRGDVFRRTPVHEKIYRDFYAHPEFDSYWKQKGFWTAGYYDQIKDIPMFFVTGWYDYFAEGVLNNFAALAKTQKTAKKLLVGPWPHGVGGSVCGGADFGDAARVDQLELMAEWFDHTLRGRDFAMKSPVRIFRMGGADGARRNGRLHHGGEWRDAPSWPLPGTRPARYYLRASGRLAETAPGRESPSAWRHDPKNPVPTIGGRYDGRCADDQVCAPKSIGCSDALPLDRRSDVVSFMSAPLAKAVEITGAAKARLWVASDAAGSDFMVKLIDVYPDGFALILAEGQVRTRAAGGARKVEIPLESTSNRFAEGHRIRVDIASSNFPRSEPHPLPARNTVYHEAGRASHVELPLSPAAGK